MTIHFNRNNNKLFSEISKQLVQTGNNSQTPLLRYTRSKRFSLDSCETRALTISDLLSFNQTASHLIRVMNAQLKRKSSPKEYIQELDGMFKTCDKIAEVADHMYKKLRSKFSKAEAQNYSPLTTLYEPLTTIKEKIETKVYKIFGWSPEIPGYTGSSAILNLACYNKDRKLALELIEKGVDLEGYFLSKTPFHVACIMNLPEVALKLLEKGIQVDPLCKMTQRALNAACRYGMKEVILKLGLHMLSYVDNFGDSILHRVCSGDHPALALVLIDMGADIHATNKEGITPLMSACDEAKFEQVALKLIEKGALVNIADDEGTTVLMAACANSTTKVILALLAKDAQVDVENKNHETPLLIAIAELPAKEDGFTQDTIVQLITKCSNLERVDEHGNTALLLACKYGFDDVLATLLAKNAQVDVVNNNCETPLLLVLEALNNDDTDLTQATLLELIEKGADIHKADKDGNTPLHLACKYGLDLIVRKLIEKRALVEVENNEKESPFFVGLKHARLSVQAYSVLLNNGCDIHKRDKAGNTALHLACERDGLEVVVAKLLEKGANCNEVNEVGNTPLHVASFFGLEKTITKLLENGALVDVENKANETPLLYCIKYKSFSTIEQQVALLALIEKSDVQKADMDGNTALHLACGKKGFEKGFIAKVTAKLLEKGADINAVNRDLETPLHRACKFDEESELCLELIEKGAKIDARDRDANTVLHIACSNEKLLDVCIKLLDRGADIEATNTYKRTPLHQACRNKNSENIALALIAKGADIHKIDFFDNTPFSFACKNGQKESAKKLLEMGAVIDCKTENNLTPFLGACSSGLEDIALELITRGADVHKKSFVNQNALSLICESKIEAPMLFSKLIELKVEFDLADSLGRTPLLFCCLNEHAEQALKLIELGANIHQQTASGVGSADGRTLLHWACIYSKMGPVVAKLVEKGLNVNAKNKEGKTPLGDAHPLIAVQLIDLGADVHEVYDTVDKLIQEGDKSEENAKLILKLLEKGIQSSSKDHASDNLILLCRYNESYWQEVALKFIEGIAYDSNIRDKASSLNAFQWACHSGMKDVAKKLMELGADIHEVSNKKETTLHLAIRGESEELALHLIEKGVNVHQLDANGGTAFSWACYKMMPQVIAKLLEKGFKNQDFAKQCGALSNNTPLHYIFRHGFHEALKFVHFDTSLDILVKNSEGMTPFSCAVNSLEWPEESVRMKQFFKTVFCKFPAICERIETHGNTDFLAYLTDHPDILINNPKNDPAANPLEVAFFFNDIPMARAIASKMTKDTYSAQVAALSLSYKASQTSEFIFRMHFDMNPSHLAKGLFTDPIPNKPAGSTLDNMLTVFDTSNFSDPKKPGYYDPKAFSSDTKTSSAEGLRKILESFIDTVQNKKGFKGEPEKETAAYYYFYNTIENAFCGIAHNLLMREDSAQNQKIKTETVIEFLRDVELCGPRVFSTAVRLYHKVVRRVEPTFENLIYGVLASYRSVVLDALVPEGAQSIHDYNILMKNLGKKLGIPGAQELSEFNDMYGTSGEGVDIEKAEKLFYMIYNSYNIVTQSVEPALLDDDELREKYGPWWKVRTPKEWGKNLHAKVRDELSHLDQSKASREDVVKLLESNDIYLDKSQTVEQALEDIRTHHFVETEVYEDIARNRFKRPYIVDMLMKLGVLSEKLVFAEISEAS
jgi:ankyrin repeat protein